jgi:hypothetical protein
MSQYYIKVRSCDNANAEPEWWSRQIVSPSQSNLFWNSGNVGSGVPNPLAKLQVDGSASVGSAYATTTPPASGLIVSGNAGIGTANPQAKLHVDGVVRLSSTIENSSGRPMLKQTGGVLNVVSNTSTSVVISNNSATLITVNITPSTTSSKILLFACTNHEKSGEIGSYVNLSLRRNASNLYNFANAVGYNSAVNERSSASTTYLDSPNTISSVAYTIYAEHANAANISFVWSGLSLTAMEIAA